MEQKHHDSDQPHVTQVGEENEISTQGVMKGIFVEVSLRADEDVTEEATHVLPQLEHIKVHDLVVGLFKADKISVESNASAMSSKPGRHITSLN